MRLFGSLLFLVFFISLDNYALDITIRGEWLNGPDSVMFSYYEDAATGKPAHMQALLDPTSKRFEVGIALDKPTLLSVLNEFFIVRPGDTVNIVIMGTASEPQLHFDGPKGMEHSFLIRLKASLGSFMVDEYRIDETSIESYKVAATRHYDSAILFLKDDVGQKRVSSQFEKVAQDYLTMSYYLNLLHPVEVNLISKDRLPKYYFELVNFSFFKKAELLGFREFVTAVKNYNDYYYAEGTAGEYYDSVNIALKIKSANRNFLGEVKDDLLLYTFAMLTQHGTEANKSQIETLYDYLTGVFGTDSNRLQQLKDFKHSFDIVDRPLPHEVLAQELKTPKGKSISLKDVLSSNEVIYVDFWDSWCGACLGEMPYEKQLMAELEGKQVKFISISFDADEKKWQKAIAKSKMKGDHYLMSEGFKSALAQYVKFNEIPRYLIVDQEGRLISHEAPKPSAILQDKSVLLEVMEQDGQ